MPSLSAVIITFNEEKNIARCLDSLKGVADEIIVVDSFSTDKTGEIVSSYGGKFIPHPFEGHIEQKNWAITQASFPHILSLDADEVLSPQLKKSILEVKENWEYDGYYFNRLTNYCGKWIRHTSWYPASKLRMWDSRKGRWGGLNPHDRFILNAGATKKFLQGDLLHYSYYSIEEHIRQINKFSSIVALSYFNNGRKATWFNIIFHPIWRVFRDYFLKLGFLDGFYGLVVSVNASHETFLKYVKLRNLQKTDKQKSKNLICFFNSVKSWGGGEKWHFDMSSRLQKKNYPVLVITNNKSELRQRLRETEIECLNLRISNLSFVNPYKVIKLALMLKARRVNTIIINLSADLKVAGLASKIAGVERIIYRRGSAIPIRDTFLNRFLFGSVVDEIIANSEETKRTILSINPELIDPDRIRIIYNGINLSKYDKDGVHFHFAREGDEVIIGNAGRLVRQKGQKYLLDVAEKLVSRGCNIKFVIAGDGKMENDLKNQVSRRNLESTIKFIGFVEDMKGFMESIDIFVLSSIWEGFGYVLVEAMASRVPVVAFNISSNPEIIEDNVTGFLVSPFNTDEMADKIEMLIKDKNLKESMGREGRKRVEKYFTIDKTEENLEFFLKTPLQQRI